MGQYINSSRSNVTDCLVSTGIYTNMYLSSGKSVVKPSGLTCTLANGCQSCVATPNCNRLLQQVGNSTSSDISIFEVEYNNIAANLSIFNNSLTGINSGNAALKLAAVKSSANNISYTTQIMTNDSIFPPPPNANFAACQQIGTTIGTKLPWYCSALGFCGQLNYNTSKMALLNIQIAAQQNNLPSNASVMVVAQNVTNIENIYITPILTKQQTQIFNNILNTTLLKYGSVVNNTQALLSHINNLSLSAQLSLLQQNYTYLKSNYLALNLTSYNVTTKTQVSQITNTYNQVNKSYSALLSKAKGNTALLLGLQMGSNINSDQKASSLAFQQLQLNILLSGTVSNSIAANKSMNSVNNQASGLNSGTSFGSSTVIRGVDAPFAVLASKLVALPYLTAIAAAPAFAALLSFIIGLVILIIIYLFYSNLKRQRKIVINHRTANSWRMLFILLFAAVLLFAIITYLLAASANSSAPISTFQSTFHNAKAVAIVINGSIATPQMLGCANQIYNATTSAGKTAAIVYYSQKSQACLSSTGSPIGSCMNAYAYTNTPAVMLTNSTQDSITAYSMYGSVLYASGDANFMNSCYVKLLLR